MLTSKLSIHNPTIGEVSSHVTAFESGKTIVEAVNVGLESSNHKGASITLFRKEARKLIIELNKKFKFYKLSKL